MAFTVCWRRDAPRVTGYARRHTQPSRVEDIVAETLTVARRRWDDVRKIGARTPLIPGSIAAWEYTFEPGDAGTLVTETWTDRRRGWPDWVAVAFDRTATGGRLFADFQRGNIRRTLAMMKADLEGKGRPGELNCWLVAHAVRLARWPQHPVIAPHGVGRGGGHDRGREHQAAHAADGRGSPVRHRARCLTRTALG